MHLDPIQEFTKAPPENDLPVLLLFTDDVTGETLAMKSVLNYTKVLAASRLHIRKVNASKSPELHKEFSITINPTLVLLKDGKTLWRHTGLIHVSELYSELKSKLNWS